MATKTNKQQTANWSSSACIRTGGSDGNGRTVSVLKSGANSLGELGDGRHEGLHLHLAANHTWGGGSSTGGSSEGRHGAACAQPARLNASHRVSAWTTCVTACA
jgi:hypothetical protein